MSKFTVVLLFALVIVTGYLVWWFTPAQIISRQTHGVIQCLDIPETATKTYRALKTNSFSNYLAGTVACRVDITDYHRELSHDELIESHHFFAQNVDWASAKTSGTTVKIIDDNNATARSDINFSLKTKKSQTYSEAVTISMEWKKNEAGKWQLTAVDMLGDDMVD